MTDAQAPRATRSCRRRSRPAAPKPGHRLRRRPVQRHTSLPMRSRCRTVRKVGVDDEPVRNRSDRLQDQGPGIALDPQPRRRVDRQREAPSRGVRPWLGPPLFVPDRQRGGGWCRRHQPGRPALQSHDAEAEGPLRFSHDTEESGFCTQNDDALASTRWNLPATPLDHRPLSVRK